MVYCSAVFFIVILISVSNISPRIITKRKDHGRRYKTTLYLRLKSFISPYNLDTRGIVMSPSLLFSQLITNLVHSFREELELGSKLISPQQNNDNNNNKRNSSLAFNDGVQNHRKTVY